MLVLCRKLGEKICIGGDICVTVLGISRNRVRLGIEASPDVPIHRQELRTDPGESPAPEQAPNDSPQRT